MPQTFNCFIQEIELFFKQTNKIVSTNIHFILVKFELL